MSNSTQNGFSNDARLQDAEQTLRLIAKLPVPEGLEGRLHAGLRAAPREARLLAWPQAISPARGWLRSVAAAAIVCVVAGGGWGIYSHVQPGQAPSAATSGFGSAGTVRKPLTLNGPTVTHAVPVAQAPAAVAVKENAKPAVAKVPAVRVKPAVKPVAAQSAPVN